MIEAIITAILGSISAFIIDKIFLKAEILKWIKAELRRIFSNFHSSNIPDKNIYVPPAIEMSLLDNYLKDSKSIILIWGIPGIGKTSLVVQYLNKIELETFVDILLFDCKKTNNLDEIINLFGVLHPESAFNYLATSPHSSKDKLRMFINLLRKDKYLLVIDDYQKSNDTNLDEFIHKFSLMKSLSKLVIISRELPINIDIHKFNIILFSNGLDFNNTKILLTENNQYLKCIEDDKLREIWLKTMGHPLGLKIFSELARKETVVNVLQKLNNLSNTSISEKLVKWQDDFFRNLTKNQKKFANEFSLFLFPLSKNSYNFFCSLEYKRFLSNQKLLQSGLIYERADEKYVMHDLFKSFCKNKINKKDEIRYNQNISNFWLEYAKINGDENWQNHKEILNNLAEIERAMYFFFENKNYLYFIKMHRYIYLFYWASGMWDKEIALSDKVISIIDNLINENDKMDTLIFTYLCKAYIYQSRKEIDNAEYYVLKAYDIARKTKSEYGIIRSLCILGRVQRDRGFDQIDKGELISGGKLLIESEKTLRDAVLFGKKLNKSEFKIWIIRALFALITLYDYADRNTDKIFLDLEKLDGTLNDIEILLYEINHQFHMVDFFRMKAGIALRRDKYDSAIDFVKKGLNILEINNIKRPKQEAQLEFIFAKAEEKLGNLHVAYQHALIAKKIITNLKVQNINEILNYPLYLKSKMQIEA